MKQTTIEWLANRIIDLEERLRLKEINLNDFIEEKDLLVEQAKEMEKEQIKEVFIDVSDVLLKETNTQQKAKIKQAAEQYYNETFKSE